MSLPEISSILDIPQQSSYYRMWKWKVPRRNDSERSKLTSKKNPALLEKLKEGREKGREKAIELNTRKHEYGMNEIKRLYTEEFLSYQDIAETLNNTISHQSIKTWLSEVCTLRKPGEAILLKWFKKNNVTINEFIESVDINGHSIIIKNYKISKEKMKKLYSVALKYRKDNKQLN